MVDDRLCNPGAISNWFWSIVQRANKDRARLESILESLPTDDVRRFALEFHDAASALWGPPYIDHLTYRSEDDIEDVSHWVVSQGKDMYTAVCAHPEIVATYENTAHRNMPALAFVADGIVADRLGDDWDLYADYQDFADSGYATVSDYWEAQKTHRP